MAEWIERSPRSREVTGSSPGRAKPKALKLVQVVSSLDARDKTRTGGPGVWIFRLGVVIVYCACDTMHQLW